MAGTGPSFFSFSQGYDRYFSFFFLLGFLAHGFHHEKFGCLGGPNPPLKSPKKKGAPQKKLFLGTGGTGVPVTKKGIGKGGKGGFKGKGGLIFFL